MRLDGFASWRAAGETGELVTRPFRCDGDRLFVNADAPRGSIAVEVLDESGAAIDGFEADACQPIHTDTLLDDAAGWVRWKNSNNLKPLQGKTVTLRFVLKDADLFAFRIADEKTMNLTVPRATRQ